MALKRQGYLRQIDLAEELAIARSTVSNFFNNRPVDRQNFLDICDRLNLDWEEIVHGDSIEIQDVFVSRRDAPGLVLQNISSMLHHENSNILTSLQSPYGEKGKLIPPHNLPLSNVSKFVGRSQEMEILHEKLQQGNSVGISIIAGMGGVGKTELALQYAQSHFQENHYPGGICWLNAGQGELSTQIINFARSQLDVNPPQDLDLKTQVKYCWGHWNSGDVLLVLDDVVAYEDIQDYLPPSPSQFKILITTRHKDLLRSSQRFDLDVLEPKVGEELLIAYIDQSRWNREVEAGKSICADLGYLPLGIELVGRYLERKSDLSLGKMRQRLSLEHSSLTNHYGDMTAQRGVKAAFELSWKELNEEQQRLAYFLSLFALAPIPWSAVEQCLPGEDEEELEDNRDEMVNLSLLSRKGEGFYQLHQLIREFFQGKGNVDHMSSMKEKVCEVMVSVAKGISQTPTLQDIERFAPYIPHLQEVATVLTEWVKDEDIVGLFFGLGSFYRGQGAYEEAKPWCEKCLSVTRSRLGEEHPDVAASLNNLALLYYFQGRYSEAEPLYQEALEMSKRLLGEEHPDVAASLNNLALLYYFQGRYSEAEPLYQEALEMSKRLLGKEHPYVATSLNNLALLYYSQGRYSEAEPLYKEALEMSKRLRGEEHPDVAASLNNLALLYDSQERYSEAEPLYKEALEMSKRLRGEEHPDVAASLNNLALLYKSQGRYTEAEPLYQEALEMRTRLRGEEHPDVATSLNNLALLYDSQGRYTEAEPLYKEALEMRTRLRGKEHPDVATSLNNLALLYDSQGRYSEAEPLYKEALEMRTRLRGKEHPDVATSLNNLALLYDSQGRYSEAEPLYKEALEMRTRLRGKEHPDVATSLNNLALLYDSQGRYSEAEPLYKEALEMRERLLGEEHPDVAQSLNNLAQLYNYQGKYTEAEPLYKEALEMRERLLGEEHPDVADSLNNLAQLYSFLGKYSEAEPLYKEALDIAERKLGKEHPRTIIFRNNLEGTRKRNLS